MSHITLKAHRLVAANSKWKLYFDHIADAQGNEVLDFLVIEGVETTDNHITGIVVLPVVEDRIVLLHCYRHALGSELWEAPRGFLNSNEDPVESARRELTEETGLACVHNSIVALGTYAPEPSTLAARGAVFAATSCKGDLALPHDEIGLRKLHAFSRREVAELIRAGQIDDAGTLIAYYRYCELYPAGPGT